MNFDKKELEILRDVAVEVEEVFENVRKGVPQSKYIFQVEPGDWDDWNSPNEDCSSPIPESLVGSWMMSYPSDLRYEALRESLGSYDWVKCKKKQTVSYVWVEQ